MTLLDATVIAHNPDTKRTRYSLSPSCVGLGQCSGSQCCGSASRWCGSGFDLITLMWIRILVPDKGTNPWKSAQIGSYSIDFGLSSANWCGSGSGSRSSLSLWWRSGSTTLPDPWHFETNLDFWIWTLDYVAGSGSCSFRQLQEITIVRPTSEV